MNDLQIFNSSEFGQIRTITKDDEPLFCLGDLCGALELTAKEVNRRLSDEVVSKHPIADKLGRMQETLFVNEDGLYDVILESRKENAKKFRKWVTSEVLPSIRKNGEYKSQKKLSAMEQLKLQNQAILEVDEKVENLTNDFNAFKQDMPLLALECERITKAKNKRVIDLIGGKNSNAYRNNSLRSKVYRDIDGQLRREFGINTYKAIKRSQCEKAIEIMDNYQLPVYLQEQVDSENAQMRFDV